jgi:hypothetical protein
MEVEMETIAELCPPLPVSDGRAFTVYSISCSAFCWAIHTLVVVTRNITFIHSVSQSVDDDDYVMPLMATRKIPSAERELYKLRCLKREKKRKSICIFGLGLASASAAWIAIFYVKTRIDALHVPPRSQTVVMTLTPRSAVYSDGNISSTSTTTRISKREDYYSCIMHAITAASETVCIKWKYLKKNKKKKTREPETVGDRIGPPQRAFAAK